MLTDAAINRQTDFFHSIQPESRYPRPYISPAGSNTPNREIRSRGYSRWCIGVPGKSCPAIARPSFLSGLRSIFHNRDYDNQVSNGKRARQSDNRHPEAKEVAMKQREIVPNERECISQCILKFWSGSSQPVDNREDRYERCLTNCDVCGSA
jgi:hypothetical protein